MRSAYQDNLDAFSGDLIDMCDVVGEVLTKACSGLLNHSLEDAEQALSLSDELQDIRNRCTTRAMELLALQGPVARDLRQVVSSIYIVEDLDRMGSMAKHIASAARRRHPDSAIPDALHGYFSELTRLCLDMLAKIRGILSHPDPEGALTLEADDDAVDDIHKYLMTILTAKDWEYGTAAAVDTTLLARFFERFADRCVNVAAHIIFLTTGLNPDEYLEQRRRDEEAEMFNQHFKV